jgi:hypothetical protein
MRFQRRGADGSFEWLFLAESVGSDSTADFENRRIELGCAYKRFDLSLFRRLMSIRSS